MSRRTILFAASLLLWSGLLASPAAASQLDDLRAQGVVAERFDGFVEVRTENAPADARGLVDEVNSKRRQVYEARAREQGVAITEVGKIYAKEIFQKAPAGTYLRLPDGSYSRK